jgi:hypothetical protein
MKQETEQVERLLSAKVRPQQHSSGPAIANPLPLGLLSLATGIALDPLLYSDGGYVVRRAENAATA